MEVAENNTALGANCVELGTCDRKEQSVIGTLHSKKSQIKQLQIQAPRRPARVAGRNQAATGRRPSRQ